MSEPASDSPVIVINVFTVAPEKLDALMPMLDRLATALARAPGFRSCRMHRGLDGKSAVNYAVWDDQDAWRAATRLPVVADAMAPIMAVATFQPRAYAAGAKVQAETD
ncbi:antibiotic biosynthesis monooxygenase family protein [Brevundimonas sp. 2R-24]|uniref:Antibiotic biosynthesis monooxygenase family protein n=1 Tax=Peiella sedimenti TaxID=3061083 RepID=A0ABT8SI86_9CAUL|nr:antibiotic biosynthesis monooxygenase family protein [Caulobacteraceae bacterium XZ-24]